MPSSCDAREQAISRDHVTVDGNESLTLSLPAAERYAISGPELVRIQLPPYVLSCDIPITPESILNRRRNKQKKYEYEVKLMHKPVEAAV